MIKEAKFVIELNSGLDELEEYLKITEEYLKKAEKDFVIHGEKQVKKISMISEITPEELDEIKQFYGEKHWDYAEKFPIMLRSSFFVSAYSLLEHKMALICGWLKKDERVQISWSDLKGDTLDQFKLYCKLASLELSDNSKPWQEIQNYSRLRNCIVHNKGLIDEARQEKELRVYVIRNNIIQNLSLGLSRPRDQVALTEDFCKEVIKTLDEFLNNALKAYELQRQEHKVNT